MRWLSERSNSARDEIATTSLSASVGLGIPAVYPRLCCGARGWGRRPMPGNVAPQASLRSARATKREAQQRRNLRLEVLESVVAAALHGLPCAAVERNRFAPVEHLVPGLHEQKIAFGARDALHLESFELVEVRAGQVVALAGVRVELRSEVGFEILV